MDFKRIECFLTKIKKEWEVPGIGIGIVFNGDIIYMKGVGCRQIGDSYPVTPETLFCIGSITKSYTATGIGILTEEMGLKLDDPVKKYIAEFPWENLTVRNLLCHQTGLPFYVENLLFTNKIENREKFLQVINKIEGFIPSCGRCSYSNFMYVVLGILIERISGKNWEDFIKEKILIPLEMQDTIFSFTEAQKRGDLSDSYFWMDNKLVSFPAWFKDDEDIFMSSAGGIISNVKDQCKWILFNLNKSKRIIKASTLKMLHSPYQMIQPPDRNKDISFEFYGAGWKYTIYRNEPIIRHGGHVKGYSSEMAFLPHRDFGVVVLSNLAQAPVGQIVSMYLIDTFLKREPVDWNKKFKEFKKRKEEKEKRELNERYEKIVKNAQATLKPSEFKGTYRNEMYGEIQIAERRRNMLKIKIKNRWYNMKHLHYNIFEFFDEIGRRFEIKFNIGFDGVVISLDFRYNLKDPTVEFTKEEVEND